MINQFIHKAMTLLLDGDNPILTILREQYCVATIESIEYTGAGLYVNFNIPDSVKNLPEALSFCFGDIEGCISPSNRNVGFLLWIEHGIINFLEVYTYGESWPENITGFTLNYIERKRDLDELKKYHLI